MGLNLAESNAVNRVVEFLTTGHDHTGKPVSRGQAVLHLSTLAEGAYKRLSAGVNGEKAFALLDEHWHPERTKMWALEHNWWSQPRLYSTEVRARRAAERYACAYAEPNLAMAFTWVPMEDEPGSVELLARIAGNSEPLRAEMWTFPIDVDVDDSTPQQPATIPPHDDDQADADAEPEPLVRATPAEVAAAYASSATKARAHIGDAPLPEGGGADYALSMCALVRDGMESLAEDGPPQDRMWESIVFLESAVRHLALEANEARAERDVPNAVNPIPTVPAETADTIAELEAEFPDDDQADAHAEAPTVVHALWLPQLLGARAATRCGRTDPRDIVAATESTEVTCPDCLRPADGATEREPVVHLPRLDVAGNPTSYALCDNGERYVAPGTLSYGGPAFGKSDANCPTCIEIDENGDPEDDDEDQADADDQAAPLGSDNPEGWEDSWDRERAAEDAAVDEDRSFDPEVPGRLRTLLADGLGGIPAGATITARENMLFLSEQGQADLAEMLERTNYAETSRRQLADTCAKYRSQRDDAYDAYARLRAIASRVDFDRSESALPQTQEQWIEFVRSMQDALESLVDPWDRGTIHDPAAVSSGAEERSEQ